MKKIIISISLLLVALLGYQQWRWWRQQQPVFQGGVRIVSLSPTLTEILFELGAGDHVVGVTNFCNYPAEARSRQRVGDLINPDLEKIVYLAPTSIFAERWSSTKIVARLREMHFQVVEVPSPKSIDEIYEIILTVGRSVQREARAQDIVADMKHRIEAIREKARQFVPSPSLYVEIDLPTWTVGRPSYINEAIALCGARNLFEDIQKPALLASQETIIQRDPDIILSFEAAASDFRKRPGWGQISAVKRGKIIDRFNRDLFSRGNFRLVQGMEELQARMSAFEKESLN